MSKLKSVKFYNSYFLIILILFVLFIFMPFKIFGAVLNNPDQNRRAFLAALSDLQHGKQTNFNFITAHLNHYALYPYLLYADLAVHIDTANPDSLQNFLVKYYNTPLAPHLRKLWLYQLAEKKDWKNFLAVYPDTNTDINLACDQREALWESGEQAKSLKDLALLLNKNMAIPKACLNILAKALSAGNIAENLIWAKIQQAFENNNPGLALQLVNFLPENQKDIFIRLKLIYQNPLLVSQSVLYTQNIFLNEQLLLIGIRKLSHKNPVLAASAFEKIQNKIKFSPDTLSNVIAIIAVDLAQNHDPHAAEWLKAIPEKQSNTTIHAWQIRTALWKQDWSTVKLLINALTPAEKKTAQWRYWMARALEKTGQKQWAENIYHDLSINGDFYGQLASIHLNQTPLMAIKQMKVSPSQINALASLPAIQRAHELYALHWLPESVQEWQWAIDHLPAENYLAAAELAVQWGWFERAIFTVNLINDGSNITVKFPLAYQGQIINNAEKNRLNPAVLFALIRQESLFTPYAHSSAGAIGLMQLMPGTAFLMANHLHLNMSVNSLINPDINLYLGSVYLKKLLDLFNQQEVLAIAAYNAGPNRIKKWLPPVIMPADVWIENIPYSETRNYVKNILTAATFYEKELNLPIRLSQRVGNL